MNQLALERCAKEIVDAAFQVHRQLGPGLLERIYETCFCHELQKRRLKVERQVALPIVYDGRVLEDGLRLDLLVESQVIVELKASEQPHPVWEAQLLSYLRLANKPVGFIVNFNVPLIKDGIRRMKI